MPTAEWWGGGLNSKKIKSYLALNTVSINMMDGMDPVVMSLLNLINIKTVKLTVTSIVFCVVLATPTTKMNVRWIKKRVVV